MFRFEQYRPESAFIEHYKLEYIPGEVMRHITLCIRKGRKYQLTAAESNYWYTTKWRDTPFQVYDDWKRQCRRKDAEMEKYRVE